MIITIKWHNQSRQNETKDKKHRTDNTDGAMKSNVLG
jgi:hypothetical protein